MPPMIIITVTTTPTDVAIDRADLTEMPRRRRRRRRSYFNVKSVPSQVMKIKDLMPKDAESGRMIDWMERGVNDALQNKYLKTLLLCVCEAVGGLMIEEYAFSFSYPNSEITPNQMRSSACKIDVLIHLIGALDEMPEERTILMKLLYCDDFTAVGYEPPCFRGCTEEVNNQWTKNPMKMKVANVNSKHLVFDLEVKSVLYGSEVIQDVDVSLGAGCVEVVASDLEIEPADSRESPAQFMEIGRTNGKGSFKGESSSQSKRSRKASVSSSVDDQGGLLRIHNWKREIARTYKHVEIVLDIPGAGKSVSRPGLYHLVAQFVTLVFSVAAPPLQRNIEFAMI